METPPRSGFLPGSLRAVLGVAMSAVCLATAGPSSALPPGEKGPATVKVTGHTGDKVAMLGGTFTPAHIDLTDAGVLIATGALTGTVTQPGALAAAVSEQITLPVDLGQSTATCRMLDIALGPADLTAAGRPMHLDQTVLNITMQQGPGTRLDVPVCATAELVRGPRPAASPALRDMLNQILGLLGQGG